MTPKRRITDHPMWHPARAAKTAHNLFTGCLLIVFFFLMILLATVIGPEKEAELFPIVEDVKITLIKEDREEGFQDFTVTARKVRSCEVIAIKVLQGDSPTGPLRLAHYALRELPNNRALGEQSYSGSVVGEVGNYIRIDTIHRCHRLWDTVSSPWAEWTR